MIVDAFRGGRKVNMMGVLREHNRQEPYTVNHRCECPPTKARPGSWPSIQTLAHLGTQSFGDMDTLAIDDSPAALTRNTLLLTILTAAATTTSGDIRARLFFMLFQLHVAPVVPDAIYSRLVRLLGTLLSAATDTNDKKRNQKRVVVNNDDDDDAGDPQYVSFADNLAEEEDDVDDDAQNNNNNAEATSQQKKPPPKEQQKTSAVVFETLAVRGDELDAALRRGLACVSLGKRRHQVAKVCAAWLKSAATAGDAARHFKISENRDAYLKKCRKYGLDPVRTGRREFDLWSRERRVGLPRRYGNAAVWDDKELDFSGQTTSDLRFAIGESVKVYLGAEGWLNGKIVDFYYREKDWEDHDHAPYQVALDEDPRLIFAPEDDDALVKSSNRTRRTKTGNIQRPNLTFLDDDGQLPGFFDGAYDNRRQRRRPNDEGFSDDFDDDDDDELDDESFGEDDDATVTSPPAQDDERRTLLPLDHLFDLAHAFGLFKAGGGYHTPSGGGPDGGESPASSSDVVHPLFDDYDRHLRENENFDDVSENIFYDPTTDEGSPDDMLPCLFDLAKRIYGLAAETFLRHNVCFDFGQGATIDTSLALIHVRRVDLSRALSCQLFAKKKQLQASKAAKHRKKLQQKKKIPVDDPKVLGITGVVSGCCGPVPE